MIPRKQLTTQRTQRLGVPNGRVCSKEDSHRDEMSAYPDSGFNLVELVKVLKQWMKATT